MQGGIWEKSHASYPERYSSARDVTLGLQKSAEAIVVGVHRPRELRTGTPLSVVSSTLLAHPDSKPGPLVSSPLK